MKKRKLFISDHLIKGIKFVYDEPAMVVNANGNEYLVVGDLHIGMELELYQKGVHLFNASDKIAARIKKIMKDFSLSKLIILGDVKHSILYPDVREIRLLKEFFNSLSDFEINIVAGNHDAHLSEIINHDVKKELIIENFGFVHGNRKPDENMMNLDYIVSAHDHLAVRIHEKKGAIFEQKAWGIYKLNKTASKKYYKKVNPNIKLISMPAFNDLIMGKAIEKVSQNRINTMLSSRIFSYSNAEIYNLLGQKISLTH